MQPDFKILINSQNINEHAHRNLMGIVHRDQRGWESDTLEIIIADPEAKAELPPRGRTAQIWIGYKGYPLDYRGAFEVDEVEHAGGAEQVDQITTRCKATNMRKSLKKPLTRSWHETKLGDLVAKIASDHDLQYRVSSNLQSIELEHIDQTNESDLHLITRLSEEYGAIGKVSDGYLLFVNKGESKTASGLPLPITQISRSQTESHVYTIADREQFTGVKAEWRDTSKGKKESVIAGSSENAKTLRKTFKSEVEAQAAAASTWRAISKGKESINIECPSADGQLFAEMPLILRGWRREIDGAGWVIDSIVTTLDADGWSQSITAERGEDG